VNQARIAAVVYTTSVTATRRQCRAIARNYNVPFYDATHAEAPAETVAWPATRKIDGWWTGGLVSQLRYESLLYDNAAHQRRLIDQVVIDDVLALVR